MATPANELSFEEFAGSDKPAKPATKLEMSFEEFSSGAAPKEEPSTGKVFEGTQMVPSGKSELPRVQYNRGATLQEFGQFARGVGENVVDMATGWLSQVPAGYQAAAQELYRQAGGDISIEDIQGDIGKVQQAAIDFPWKFIDKSQAGQMMGESLSVAIEKGLGAAEKAASDKAYQQAKARKLLEEEAQKEANLTGTETRFFLDYVMNVLPLGAFRVKGRKPTGARVEPTVEPEYSFRPEKQQGPIQESAPIFVDEAGSAMSAEAFAARDALRKRLPEESRIQPQGYKPAYIKGPSLSEHLDDVFGVKDEAARIELHARRGREIREAFKDDKDYADYSQWMAENIEGMREIYRKQLADAAPLEPSAAAHVRATSTPLENALFKTRQGEPLTKADKLAVAGMSTKDLNALREQHGLSVYSKPDSIKAIDETLLKNLGLTAAAVAVVAPFASEEQLRDMSLLGAALMIKPKGGMWHPEAAGRLAKPIWNRAATRATERNVVEQTTRMTRNYLNKHAATEGDPLRDVQIPFGEHTEGFGRVLEAATSSDKASTILSQTDHPRNLYEMASKAKPDETIYKFQRSNALNNYLEHVGDYLRQNVRPEDLPKYDLVRAVKETAKWDAEMAKKMKEAARSGEGTIEYKTYPDGMKWVEVQSKEALQAEGNVMGHCVGGYCEAVAAGESKIYSLRDAKGESHVTVQVTPNKAYLQVTETPSVDISQIKGKQNRAPVDKYLPYVQDFVRSGKWGEVNDLANAKLYDRATIARSMRPDQELFYNERFKEQRFLTEDEYYTAQSAWGDKLHLPSGQAGFVDPAILKTIAATGVGAAAGAYLAPENPMTGAVMGALGLNFARKVPWSSVVKGLDYSGGIGSTRVRNINPALALRWRSLELDILKSVYDQLAIADPFLVALNKLPKELQQRFERAALSEDGPAIAGMLNEIKDPKFKKAYADVRKVYGELGQKMKDMGIIKNTREIYFRRIVKDREGLLNALGQDLKTKIEQKLKEAEVTAMKNRGTGLTSIEESNVINNSLLEYRAHGYQPGFAKARRIAEVTEALQPYYASLTESTHAYIRGAVEEIEKAKFFGKNAAYIQKGGQQYLNIDASVGNIIREQIEGGKLTYKQASEVADILQSRFGPGERASSAIVQDMKNIGYAGLLGNIVSASVQLGDLAITTFVQGLRPTLVATTKVLTGRPYIHLRDLGLVNHISEEFTSVRGTAKFLNTVLKAGGFSAVDTFGKSVSINAALHKLYGWAQTEKGAAKIAAKYGTSLGDELPAFLDDLKARKLTDRTRLLAFSELSDVQPISRAEVTQLYLDNPSLIGKGKYTVVDARMLNMLKSFMLKQIDLVRNSAYNEIKKGNVATGLGNLARYSVLMGMAGVSVSVVKDWLTGKDVKVELADATENILKTFGWSTYALTKAAQGKPIEATINVATPPYRMMDDIVRMDPKAVQYIPVIGKLYYYHYGEGSEEGKRKKKEKQRFERMTDVDRFEKRIKSLEERAR